MVLDDVVRQKLTAIKLHTDPLVQAQMIGELKKEIDIPNIDIAQYLEIKPAYLSHLVRILKLPEIIIDGYMSKQITFTHLVILSRLKKPEDMVTLYEEILTNNLNVAQTEKRVRHMLYLIDTVGKYISAERLNTIKNKISMALDDNVSISIIQTRIKAKIVIEATGDLQQTSNFIESFSYRFRPKREKKKKEHSHQIDVTNSGQALLPEKTSSFDETKYLTPQELQDEAKEKENEKKYRFDPDF